MRRAQRAVELIERDARLQRRRRLDQIGDRLGLHQIALAVEEGAQRELARAGPAARRRRSPRRTIASSTTGLPCALISTTSSPVYERGAGNQVDDHFVERRDRRRVRCSQPGERGTPGLECGGALEDDGWRRAGAAGR